MGIFDKAWRGFSTLGKKVAGGVRMGGKWVVDHAGQIGSIAGTVGNIAGRVGNVASGLTAGALLIPGIGPAVSAGLGGLAGLGKGIEAGATGISGAMDRIEQGKRIAGQLGMR